MMSEQSVTITGYARLKVIRGRIALGAGGAHDLQRRLRSHVPPALEASHDLSSAGHFDIPIQQPTQVRIERNPLRLGSRLELVSNRFVNIANLQQYAHDCMVNTFYMSCTMYA